MGKTKFLFLLLVCSVSWASILAGLAGCNTVAEKLIQKPKVALEKVNLRDANARGATVAFSVGVDNPNAFGLTVDSIRYEVELGGKRFTSGVVDKPISVAAEKKTTVEIPIEFKYTDIFESLLDVVSKKTSSYRIKGDASFGLLSIPFDQTGDLKLR